MTEPDAFDHDDYDDDDPPRSIFSALWFRALMVMLVLGVVAVLAAPSLLEVVAPRAPKAVASASSTGEGQAPAGQTGSPSAGEAQATPGMSVTPPAPVVPAVPPLAARRGAESPAASAHSEAPKAPAAAKPAESVVALREGPAPESPKVAPVAPPAPKSAAPGTVMAVRAVEPSAAKAPEAEGATGGSFWVQVGAFKDREAARRLAARLRQQNYQVEESTSGGQAAPAPSPAPAQGGGDRYEVFVAGTSVEEIGGKVAGRNITVQGVAGGVVLRPTLPLAEALALSKDLAGDGRRVQVRRSGDPGRPSAAASAAGAAYHRVRVGAFPDKASAQAVLRDLEGKGYQPFIARGGQ